MKRYLFLLGCWFLVGALASGCTTTGRSGEAAPIDESAAAGEAGQQGGATTTAASEGGAWTGSPLENPDSLLYTKVIYFDFDSADIKPEFTSVLSAHGQYLASHPAVRITLEGHCDERGTREYNMALGERRANMIKRFVMAEGVAEEQISTVSYGEERPVDPSHNEAAWALNRRVELVY